jgi:hypothetical protein
MSLPRSVAEVLKSHVTLEVEGIDRMYLNVYQPRLQTDRGVASFFRFHRGEPFASSALMNPMSKSFIAAVDRFVSQEQIPRPARINGQPAQASAFNWEMVHLGLWQCSHGGAIEDCSASSPASCLDVSHGNEMGER